MALGTTASLAVAALVAGAVGAGTAALVAGSCKGDAAPAGSPAAEVSALEERLAKQEKEIASLRSRLEEAVHAKTAPGVVTSQANGEIQIFDPDTLKPATGEPGMTPPAADTSAMTPEERAKYESVYKSMREKEQEDARRARAAAQESAMRARLDRIPAEAALTDAQKDNVVKVLSERAEKLRKAFEDARSGGGGVEAFRAAQEKATAIRQEAHDALLQSLTADQVKAVEQAVDRGSGMRGGTLGGNRGNAVGVGGGRRNAGGTGGAGGAGGESQPPR